MRASHKRRLLLLLAAGWLPGQALAVCIDPIIFDPSNFAKNTISAAQHTLSLAKQIEAYIRQALQYETQLKNLAGATAADLIGVAWNYQDLQEAIKYAQQLRSLYGTLQQAQHAFDLRLDEARQGGMSFSGYLQMVAGQLSRGNLAQKQRVQNERRILENVKGDYEAAERFAMQIPMTEGLNESVGLMNAQMNRVLVQNARMVELMGVNLGQAQDSKTARALQDKERRRAGQEELTKQFEDVDRKARDDLGNIGR